MMKKIYTVKPAEAGTVWCAGVRRNSCLRVVLPEVTVAEAGTFMCKQCEMCIFFPNTKLRKNLSPRGVKMAVIKAYMGNQGMNFFLALYLERICTSRTACT